MSKVCHHLVGSDPRVPSFGLSLSPPSSSLPPSLFPPFSSLSPFPRLPLWSGPNFREASEPQNFGISDHHAGSQRAGGREIANQRARGEMAGPRSRALVVLAQAERALDEDDLLVTELRSLYRPSPPALLTRVPTTNRAAVLSDPQSQTEEVPHHADLQYDDIPLGTHDGIGQEGVSPAPAWPQATSWTVQIAADALPSDPALAAVGATQHDTTLASEIDLLPPAGAHESRSELQVAAVVATQLQQQCMRNHIPEDGGVRCMGTDLPSSAGAGPADELAA